MRNNIKCLKYTTNFGTLKGLADDGGVKLVNGVYHEGYSSFGITGFSGYKYFKVDGSGNVYLKLNKLSQSNNLYLGKTCNNKRVFGYFPALNNI
jgi:hypothetical protein